ncbi:MAG: hypothetical protein HYZ46_08080 [Nitrosomonadales bacterium]|nr:hypothetical protein [Nitrosomonadales bacterium]
MTEKRHLVVSITAHGYGHVAQTAPVLNALYRLMPDLKITVRCALEPEHLRSRIQAPFSHLAEPGDIGMLMSSPLDVRVAESCAAYRDLHAGWDRRVANEAQLLRDMQADFVFSNVGYLPLAGAVRAGISCAALCSLNWADIYRYYCGDDDIAAQMQSCYANAGGFLRATPGMEMSDLPNVLPVSPIAAVGRNRRAELDRLLRLPAGDRLVLVSMGGIASRLPVGRWPRMDRVRWLVPRCWQVDHPDAIEIESLPLGFSDLLASSDALICKPGYGSFVEAACSGVPVLYVSRANWPESSCLIAWLEQHGRCREVTRDEIEAGEVGGALRALWNLPNREPLEPEGTRQVADWLAAKLSA